MILEIDSNQKKLLEDSIVNLCADLELEKKMLLARGGSDCINKFNVLDEKIDSLKSVYMKLKKFNSMDLDNNKMTIENILSTKDKIITIEFVIEKLKQKKGGNLGYVCICDAIVEFLRPQLNMYPFNAPDAMPLIGMAMFEKQRPCIEYAYGLWFPLDEEGNERRIEICKNVLDELNLI